MDLRQRSTLQIIFVFLLFTLILATILIFTQRLYFGYSNNKTIMDNMILSSKDREHLFKSFTDQSTQTLHSIRELKLFDNYLENSSNEETLKNIFLACAKSQPNFMQLRFLDKDGNEKIRVDRAKEGEEPFLIGKDKLQNKANRYYFHDSKTKEYGKVWFSALDLNIERGRVEIPFKPTLRAVLPIKHNDKFGGIIIINYFMENFIKKFVDIPLYDMVLFNDKGYPLYHYEKEKSWSYYKSSNYTIKDDYEKSYVNIFNNKFYATDDFISRKLDVPILGGINLIMKLKKSFVDEEDSKLTLHGFFTLGIIFLLSLPLSILIVKIFSKTLFNLETVRNLNKNLNNMTLRNEIVLRASEIGLWEWDLVKNKISWDTHMYDIYGVDKNKQVDLESVWDKAISRENGENIKEEFYNSIENNKEFDTFFWINTVDGKRKYIKALGIVESNEHGKVTKVIGINQDITDLKLKEEKILQSQEELEAQNHKLQKLNRELEESETEIQLINENLEEQVKQKTKENIEQFEVIQQQSKLASMGEMLGNISHQWRQPLNALSALVFNVKFKYELGKLDNETIEHFSQKGSSIIKSMDNTIEDFRNFFKPDKQKKEFNICECIDTIMNIIEGSYKNNNITLEINCNDTVINGFKSELEQVFLVVLSNSKDAIKERSIQDGKVIVDIIEKENFVQIDIQDNAGGIDKEIIRRVFEPYFTTKHQDIGTGIGLYMSKMIIEKSMSGSITAKNKDNGVLVSIVLPKEKNDIN